MAVHDVEFRKLYATNPSARATLRNSFGEITGINVTLRGIRGGDSWDAQQELWYGIFLDVSTIRGETIPLAYATSPAEPQIRHVNIFHPSMCQALGYPLPRLCWGTGNEERWWQIPKHERTLVSLVDIAAAVLSGQNFDSRAR